MDIVRRVHAHIMVIVVLMIFPQILYSQAGTLDVSFDGDGIAMYDLSNGYHETAWDMELYQDTNSPNIMMLFEEWKDWESLENHIRSDTYRSILELMELSSKQPEIKFSRISSTKGMEFIEKLRV